MLRPMRLLMVACASLLAFQAPAAIVTVDGDNVRFTYDDATLFGAGTVIGDNIFFLPENFVSESLNGEGLVQAIETLVVQVEVITAGFWLADFGLAEQGDYLLVGDGASADVGGHFKVSSNTTAFTDMESISAGLLNVKDQLTEWSLESGISLGDTAGWNSDTNVDIELYNIAATNTAALGEQAFLQKKIGGIGVMVSAIPVPAAVWLFGSGILALAGWSRRRSLS